MIGIYKITSPTGRIYIGQTVESVKRFYMYSKLHCKQQPRLYNSFNKYGASSHLIEMIHECVESELDRWEIYYINLFDSIGVRGLNCKHGGANGRMSEESKRKMSVSSFLLSAESRAKISLANKGKKKPVGFGEKISKAQKGKKRSKEVCENISKGKTGKSHKGAPCSEEKKLKIGMANRGKKKVYLKPFILSEEQRKKISDSAKGNKNWLGRKHKPESIEKQKIAAKNRIITPETRKKIAALALGRPCEASRNLLLNVETGIYYNGLREACDSIGIRSDTLAFRIKAHPHKCPFIVVSRRLSRLQ